MPAESLESCDQELRRLRIVSRSAPDTFDRDAARLRIDALLELRLVLMRERDLLAAGGAGS